MKKVLIVDDSSYTRMFLKKIFIKGGFSLVYEASSREEAMDMFKIFQPDIVTLDINMSEFRNDGIDVLTAIMDIAPKTIVIIISAAGHENLISQCISLGAANFIKKPFDTEFLLQLLNSYK